MTLIKSSTTYGVRLCNTYTSLFHAWCEADHMEVFKSNLQLINLRPISWSGMDCSQYQIALHTHCTLNHTSSTWTSLSTPAGTDHSLPEVTSSYQHESLCHEEDCGSEYARCCLADGQLVPTKNRYLCGASIPFLHSSDCPVVSVHHITSHSGTAACFHW